MSHVRCQSTRFRRARTSACITLSITIAIALSVRSAHARAETPGAPAPVRDALLPYLDARHVVLPANADIRALRERRIPGFSRQTKLACSACHYGFPQLTPFGRLFKLNGYTLTGLKTIDAGDSTRSSLQLAPFPPVSAMAVTSFTHLSKTLPETQNNSVVFPDQLSLFLAGEITPKLGAFVQITYAAPDGSIGIDNTEFRFADRTHLFSQELLYGVTLNNNPSMQDVWNTVPAWGFPFMASSAAPTPMASALVDGALGQQVVGLGGYGLWRQLVYAEFTAYRSAEQGVATPLDASASNVAHNVIPYWRLALQHQFGRNYVMLGTYGLSGRLYPTGVSGPTDQYTDAAADVQVERQMNQGVLVVRSTFIHEAQTLTALAGGDQPGAANLHNTLKVFRANASYMPSMRTNFTLGYFNTTGTSDLLLYPAASISGSANGSPQSYGGIGEFDFNAWQNTRLGVQYTLYGKFNGGATSYDGAGRNAANNDALFIFAWVAF
ncbi:MAG: cytochrome C [Gemmatimonadota bacterium]|nr:cytochrome C [Gemmatimonadota bacterium]